MPRIFNVKFTPEYFEYINEVMEAMIESLLEEKHKKLAMKWIDAIKSFKTPNIYPSAHQIMVQTYLFDCLRVAVLVPPFTKKPRKDIDPLKSVTCNCSKLEIDNKILQETFYRQKKEYFMEESMAVFQFLPAFGAHFFQITLPEEVVNNLKNYKFPIGSVLLLPVTKDKRLDITRL